MFAWEDPILSATSKIDFLQGFSIKVAFFGLGGYSRDLSSLLDTARRLEVTNDEIIDVYITGRINHLQRTTDAFFANEGVERLSGAISDISLFGVISEESFRRLSPALDSSARLLLESGGKRETLESLVSVFRPVLDIDFDVRVDSYEIKGANRRLDNYSNGGRAFEVIDAVKVLKNKGKFDSDLEDRLRRTAIDDLAAYTNFTFSAPYETIQRYTTSLEVLNGLGWSAHVDDVYGSVVAALSKGAFKISRDIVQLDRQNQVPPHMATILLFQLDEVKDQEEYCREAFDLVGSRLQIYTAGITLELLQSSKGALERLISSRLEIKLLDRLSILEETRIDPITALGLFTLYNDMFASRFGYIQDKDTLQKANILVKNEGLNGNYRSAYGLALAAAGTPEGIDITIFNEFAEATKTKRTMAVFDADIRADDTFRPSRRRSITRDDSLTDPLKTIATGLLELEKLVGERLSYKTKDEIVSVASEVQAKPSSVTLQYLCMLLQNQKELSTEPVSSVIGGSTMDSLDAAFKSTYLNVAQDNHRRGNRTSEALRIFDQGYTILFGHSIHQGWNPRASLEETKPIQRPDTRTRPRYRYEEPPIMTLQQPSKSPGITVYFGGKNFRGSDEVQREIPKYTGRTGSKELKIGNRDNKFFTITMSAGEYKTMSESVLGSTIQAVEIPLEHQLLRTTIDGHKMALEERDGKSIIYNSGQLQTLSPNQVWAIGRALYGQTGSVNDSRYR